jgi:hypothetical protein
MVTDRQKHCYAGMHSILGVKLRMLVHLPHRSTVPLLLGVVEDMVSGILKDGERGPVELIKPLKLLTLDFTGSHHHGLESLPSADERCLAGTNLHGLKLRNYTSWDFLHVSISAPMFKTARSTTSAMYHASQQLERISHKNSTVRCEENVTGSTVYLAGAALIGKHLGTTHMWSTGLEGVGFMLWQDALESSLVERNARRRNPLRQFLTFLPVTPKPSCRAAAAKVYKGSVLKFI